MPVDLSALVPLVVTTALPDASALASNPHLRAAVVFGRRHDLPESFNAILRQIEITPALAVFRDGYYHLGSTGGQVRPEMLLEFLVRRSVVKSPELAVAEVEQYLEAKEIPCQLRSVVTGFSHHEAFEIGMTRFSPWGQIHDVDETLGYLVDEQKIFHPLVFPTGILEAQITFRKHLVVRTVGQTPEVVSDPPPTLDPRPPLWAIQLVCPESVTRLATWIRYPEWCVISPRGLLSTGTPPERAGRYELTTKDIEKARLSLQKFLKLDDKKQSTLALMISRLSAVQSHLRDIERAIDLRIAYEMAFSIGDQRDKYQGELRFRLAMRAARLLGGESADERRRIFKIGRDLYDMCSGAIHSGDISSEYDSERRMQILSDGMTIVRDALRKVILEGNPDWNRVLFG